MVAKGKRGGQGWIWEFGTSRCQVLYIEWINHKVLLYSTGNYIQYPVINCNGKEYQKEFGYIFYMYINIYTFKYKYIYTCILYTCMYILYIYGKESMVWIYLQYGRPGFNPWVGKIPWKRACQPTSAFLPGESPWKEEPGGLQSMRSQRVGHNWVTKHSTHVCICMYNWITLLYSRNSHIINQLYVNKIHFKKE